MSAKPAPAPTAPATPAPVPTFCGCGCGETTVRPSARFVAGHDARHVGNIGRAAITSRNPQRFVEVAMVGHTPALRAKAARVVETASRKAADKAARAAAVAAAKAAAKVAYEAAMAR